MLTIEEIRARLKDRKIRHIARAAGLHENTIRDVRDNPSANPTQRTLKALSDYLEGRK